MNGEPLPLAPRVPRAADRARPLRLRVGHQVAHRDRAHHASTRSTSTGCRGATRQRGADQDREPHRHPEGAGEGRRRARVPIAGVAWAQTRGIGAVEVRVDDGPWRARRAGRGPERRRLAAVEVGLGRRARPPHDHRPGDPSRTEQSRPTSAPNHSRTDRPATTRSWCWSTVDRSGSIPTHSPTDRTVSTTDRSNHKEQHHVPLHPPRPPPVRRCGEHPGPRRRRPRGLQRRRARRLRRRPPR